jgi:hypothetical protein
MVLPLAPEYGQFSRSLGRPTFSRTAISDPNPSLSTPSPASAYGGEPICPDGLSNRADDLVVHQSAQPVEQVGAGRRRSVGKPFGLHDLDVAQGDSGRDRVAAVCIDDQRARKRKSAK